ncbi:hypothetical protein MTR67_044617 [Solanum verrucosum]|uniref:Uncharacterized protein n=1 Tax=Solanum verrucosum TaxID=315347 RepID=A0AAF0URJ9_SOLVR|nr:hypothetical protein MTR67_044617 [Solanum verrucosum]
MTAVVGGELSGQNVFVNVEASSGTSGHPISRIGSELEALLSHPMDEDNDVSSIFDVGIAPTFDAGIAPTFDAGIAPTAQTGKSGYEVSGEAPAQLPPFSSSSYVGDGLWSSLHTRR